MTGHKTKNFCKKGEKMQKLNTLKLEIAGLQEQIAALTSHTGELQKKRNEIVERVSEIDSKIKVTEKAQNKAVTRFARGEITEDSLDEYQSTLFSLNGKKKSLASAIEIIDKDFTDANKGLEPLQDLLKRKTQSAWELVRDIELAKASKLIRRAFYAGKRAGAGYMSRSGNPAGFVEEHVYGAAFHGVSDASLNEETQELVSENQLT
jgi:chromosome segregation ATPase